MDYFDKLKRQSENPRRAAAPRGRRRIVSDIRPPETTVSPPAAAPSLKPAEAEPERPKTPAPELSIRTWEPEGTRRRRLTRRVLAVAVIAALALGLILPTFAFPRLTIIISPKVETVKLPETDLIAATAAAAPEAQNRRIPAILVEAEETFRQEYDSSGTKFFQERARGTILVYNGYSSSPQSLVARTRFQDPSGKVFRLLSALIIPGAKIEEGKIVPTSITAAVTADQPGAASNIAPTQFRIPGFRGTAKYEGFYAESPEPFAGGFTGQAKVVTAEDVKRASEDLTRRAFEALKSELDRKKPSDPDFVSPDGAREVTIVRVEAPSPGVRTEKFIISAAARGRLMAFRHSQAIEVLSALFLPGSDNLSIRAAQAQPNLSLGGSRLGRTAGELKVRAKGELNFWRAMDAMELAAILRASTPRKAEAYLSTREEIDSFRIKRFPRWLWYIPGRLKGLEVRILTPA